MKINVITLSFLLTSAWHAVSQSVQSAALSSYQHALLSNPTAVAALEGIENNSGVEAVIGGVLTASGDINPVAFEKAYASAISAAIQAEPGALRPVAVSIASVALSLQGYDGAAVEGVLGAAATAADPAPTSGESSLSPSTGSMRTVPTTSATGAGTQTTGPATQAGGQSGDDEQGLSVGAKIGIGIGVGLGVPILVALLYCAYRLTRMGKTKSSSTDEKIPRVSKESPRFSESGTKRVNGPLGGLQEQSVQEIGSKQQPAELDSQWQDQRVELHEQSVPEVDGRPRPYEME